MAKRRISDFFKKVFRQNPSETSDDKTISCRTCHSELQVLAVGGGRFHRCPDCSGTWLAASQLEELLSQALEKSPQALDTVESDGESEVGHTLAPSRKARICPSCPASMDNFKFENTGVWIDACPEGHGIWLDSGELKLLVKRRENQMNKPDEDNDSVVDAVTDLLLGSL